MLIASFGREDVARPFLRVLAEVCALVWTRRGPCAAFPVASCTAAVPLELVFLGQLIVVVLHFHGRACVPVAVHVVDSVVSSCVCARPFPVTMVEFAAVEAVLHAVPF